MATMAMKLNRIKKPKSVKSKPCLIFKTTKQLNEQHLVLKRCLIFKNYKTIQKEQHLI